jgi:hypothetical protein
VFCFCLLSSSALAAGGSAVIPWWNAWNDGTGAYISNTLTIHNITENTISVKITLYQVDGTILYDNQSRTTGKVKGSTTCTNYVEPTTGASITFDLAAHKTENISIVGDTDLNNSNGYGLIEWTQDSTVVHAVVATNLEVGKNAWGSSTSGMQTILINGGLAF